MKKCPVCEKELEKTETVCADCGYNLEQADEIVDEVLADPDKPVEEAVITEPDQTDNTLIEVAVESETVVKQKKSGKFVALIVCFAVIIALGLGMALGGWFYVKPKYTKSVELAQADMANYGMYCGLYQMSADDENTANAYAYYAQVTAEAYETEQKNAEKLLSCLICTFLLSGVMLAVGTCSLCFMANGKKQNIVDETEYNGSFDNILEQINPEQNDIEQEIENQKPSQQANEELPKTENETDPVTTESAEPQNLNETEL